MHSSAGNPLESLRTLLGSGTFGGLSDAELLNRYLTGEAEISQLAITVLVERHGPMVRRVCRSILSTSHDADDAFQATFLILARQARSIRDRESIAAWLHGVAQRVSVCANSTEARRRKHERLASKVEAVRLDDFLEHQEIHRIVHDELGRLPEKYRAPLVLCHLEGLTHEEAARRLHWPVGTVRSRLFRGRNRLKHRLIRRGAEPAVGLAVLVSAETTSAGVPRHPTESIARHTTTPAAGDGVAIDILSPTIQQLVDRAIKMMTWTKFKTAGSILTFTLSTLGLGFGLIAFAQESSTPQDKPQPPKPDIAKTKLAEKVEREQPAPEVTLSHVDRLDMGRLQVGAIAEATLGITYTGPAEQRGIAVKVDPPPFAIVNGMRMFRRKPTEKGETLAYSWTILMDTSRPGDLQGDAVFRFENQVVKTPISASVQPLRSESPKVLMITGGFGNISNNTWHKMIHSDDINISYYGNLGFMEIDSKEGPDHKPIVPDALARYDVILIDAGGAAFLSAREAYFLKLFVESGKRLVVCASPGIADATEKANLAIEPFGLKMAPDDPLDINGGYRESVERQIADDPLTERVSRLAFFRPAAITVTNPGIAKILDQELSKTGFAAISRPGKGEVVAIGTFSTMHWIDLNDKEADNLRFLRNVLTKKVK